MTLQTQGSRIVDSNGDPIRLKGTNIRGWLNMENFITGYAASESMMRAAMLAVLGRDKYELFFETLLTSFYRCTGIDLNLEGNGLQHRLARRPRALPQSVRGRAPVRG